ncbi:unnamed protein product [Clavelina lepadiformis]|uniref:Aminotransferase class V domain-containing protein n=1 Tax=Clavelina lepadiformis TaxID=159417 RepID=A0ABP0EXT4_CLALP
MAALCNNGDAGRSVVTRKFGTFQSSNIEEQLKATELPDYVPPNFPVYLPNFVKYKDLEDFPFGKIIKQRHFLLDEDWTFLNHGAFGSMLKESLSTQQLLEDYVERQPVRFIDRELFPLIVHSQKRLAQFVRCKATDISFVENATMGTNVVLNSLNVDRKSTIYYLNTTYGAVKKSLKQLQQKTGVQLQEENLIPPIQSTEDILKVVKNTLKDGTKLAIFDHIPSNAAFVMPVKELVDICHQKNVPVLIDGAHALGAIDLNIPDIGSDYYVSNCHKWLCGPKGCAFLYVKPEEQKGLKDYTPYLALQCSLNFWECVGPEVIRSRITNVLHRAVKLLKTKWNGILLAPLEMHSTMCCVSLPSRLYEGREISYSSAEEIQNILYNDHHIEVPIKEYGGKLFVRISVHIYNEIEEYQKLADAVISLLDLYE